MSAAMKRLRNQLALTGLLTMTAMAPVFAATEADYKAAYAAADAASQQAIASRNQWTTTVSTLAAAKKAAESGDFDRATAAAKEAEALARASIDQATAEKQAWKAMEIR